MDFNVVIAEDLMTQRLAELRAAAAHHRLVAQVRRRRRAWRDVAAALVTRVSRVAAMGRRLHHAPAAPAPK
jgi:hypothetical protein